MNIVEWLLRSKIAHHQKQAENIIRLLDLGTLFANKEFEAIKARAALYREWRNAGENVHAAAEAAIEGKPAPARLLSTEMGDR